jgi:sugar-specific transcriptional regulator TrmB
MTDDEQARAQAATEALERLGLTSYEAQAFVALHRLGHGTANDIHRVSDLPQSRLYGVMERLQDRGLVDIQASTPKRYRPVDLEEARARLREELDAAEARAFEYLAAVDRDEPTDRDEAVWLVRGREAVTDRVCRLAETAGRRIVFGAAHPDQVPSDLSETLARRAAAGVRVVTMGDRATAARYPEAVTVVDTSDGTPAPANAARVLLVDDATVLMSTIEPDASTETGRTEVGMWTADTGLGGMLVGIMDGAMAETLAQASEESDSSHG